jgi:hypothetical protein
MAEINSYFERFVSELNPSQTYLDDQAAGHRTLRRRLQEDGEFKKYHVATFLQGSYARDTALHPGKDVDVVVVTNLNSSVTTNEANLLMERFLRQHYNGKWLRQNRSYGIALSYVTLDVVLARSEHLSADEYQSLTKSAFLRDAIVDWKKHPLFIPDREMSKWVPTHPKAQMEATTDQNKECCGFLVPMVKVLKAWRRNAYSKPKYPKGYILERIVAENIDRMQTTYAAHCVALFRRIVANYSYHYSMGLIPTLPDPGNPSHNVAQRLDPSDFKVFYEKVRDAVRPMELALFEADKDKSAEMWQRIFGPPFPGPLKKSVNAVFPNHAITPNKPAGFA